MSIQPLTGDMVTASDPTLAKMLKKINELVQDANLNLPAQTKMKVRIFVLEKELKEMKLRLMNIG